MTGTEQCQFPLDEESFAELINAACLVLLPVFECDALDLLENKANFVILYYPYILAFSLSHNLIDTELIPALVRYILHTLLSRLEGIRDRAF